MAPSPRAEEELEPLCPSAGESSSAAARADSGRSASASGSAEAPKVPLCCRICLEAEGESDAPLLQPCRCTGTMGGAHQACLQRWINEKGDRRCEICGAQFGGDFTEPPAPRPRRAVVVRGEDGEYEVIEEDDPPVHQNACVACAFSILLLLLILPLANHLAAELRQPLPEPRPGQDPATMPGGVQDDLGASLMLLWLLARLLVMVVPFYMVGSALRALRNMLAVGRWWEMYDRPGAAPAAAAEVEMEAGRAPPAPPQQQQAQVQPAAGQQQQAQQQRRMEEGEAEAQAASPRAPLLPAPHPPPAHGAPPVPSAAL